MPQRPESTRVQQIAPRHVVSGSLLKTLGCDINADEPAGGEDFYTLVLIYET